jgi:hypothetical protein
MAESDFVTFLTKCNWFFIDLIVEKCYKNGSDSKGIKTKKERLR